MSFNGAGLFQINTAGQPVVDNTLIDTTVFNALTSDLATGLSTCITKDGQTTVTANIPLGGFKITGLGLGTATTDAARVDNANALDMCEGRLTLTTGVPVTTADVTGATTLYFTPYKGNRIALYDGSNWHMYAFTQLSITNAGVGGAVPSDVFVYDNAGTLTLEFSQWTNDTTRATALTTQNGVLVKSGATTRRYLGTIRAESGGAFADAYATRWVWNYYNRVARPMRAIDTTDSWTYTTATLRQARNSTANQLDFVIGVSEDAVTARLISFASNTDAAVTLLAAIGLDSTSAKATGALGAQITTVASAYHAMNCEFTTIPAVGRHFLAWLEYSQATGTTTWYGDAGTSGAQSGIHGAVMG